MAHEIVTPLVLDGWFVLHQFFRIDPDEGAPLEDGASATDDLPPGEAFPARVEAFRQLIAGWEDLGEQGWTGVYRIVGGGTDYMILHFRDSLEAVGEAERAVRRSPISRNLVPTGDYLSVVELGMYGMTETLVGEAQDRGIEPGSEEWEALVAERLEAEREKRYVQARLRPREPEGMPYVCFYPMDKRRNVGQNWYTLSLPERAALMADHGATGRRWAGRISQIISGSVGFDDWEWGVTLFAGNPLAFKELVTEMRYDRASAIYAEFGSFWVGHRIRSEKLVEELAG